jgi:carotenoid cleavage dioxygenase-like enzyme
MTTYLEGPFAPVTEEVTAFDLPVQGEIPEELDGLYVRNGPNPFGPVDPDTYHWFIGEGMVHGVRLGGGSAQWYRNRWVGGTNLNAARGLPDIPGPDWNGAGYSPNTHAAGFAGKLWATVEAGSCPVELDAELNSVRRNDFDGTLPNGFTAHAKYHPATGELHGVAYAWAQLLDHVQYIVVGADAKVRRCIDVPLPGMPMVHDMSVTEHYGVIYDQPCTVDLDAAFAGVRFPFRWDPDHGCRLGFLPLDADDSSAIVWVDAPLGYVFHPLNAYETAPDRVVIDVCWYPRVFDVDRTGPFDATASLQRWEIDLTRRTLMATTIDDRPIDFPRHAPGVATRAHRFGYGARVTPHDLAWHTVKYDLSSGDCTEFDHGPGRGGGEPVFVPRAGGTAEDDGWLVQFVHDTAGGPSDLVILDAGDLGRPAVATVTLPARVPLGFHGSWVPATSLPAS